MPTPENSSGSNTTDDRLQTLDNLCQSKLIIMLKHFLLLQSRHRLSNTSYVKKINL